MGGEVAETDGGGARAGTYTAQQALEVAAKGRGPQEQDASVRPQEAQLLGKVKNRQSKVVGRAKQRKGAQVVPPALLQAPVRSNPGRRGMGGVEMGDRLGGRETAARIPAHRKRSGCGGRKEGWGRRGERGRVCGPWGRSGRA